MKREKCSACGGGDLETFLDLGTSPIADAYTDGPGLDAPRYPLEVAVCSKCHLAQLLEVVDAEVLFGTGYSFYSSASPPLSAYHAAYARHLLADYPDQVAQGVLEIGCNDGDFLRHFASEHHLGVDPAVGPVLAAERRNLNVVNAAFGPHVAEDVMYGRGGEKFGLVVANHVLAHVADVSNVLAGIATALHPQGVAFIEVQYLPDLLVNNSFDLVYHEHRNYFSLTSLEAALSRHGLYVVDAELTDRQGGSLRVMARHVSSISPNGQPSSIRPVVARLLDSECWLNSLGAYEGIQGRAERIRERLRDLVFGYGWRGKTIALYGAPAKATTLLNFCGLDVVDLPYCWDTTEAKQHRHIPGTGIEIRSPWQGDRPDAFLLSAWNYARSIVKSNPGFEWVMPFPAPWILP